MDNLREELSEVPSSSSNDLSKDRDLSSSSDDSLCDLPSSSDDSLCDLSFEEWIECQTDSSFDLDDFVS